MGLIKAGMGALGGTLADQWKEFFYCEALGKDVLVTKGQKRITGRSSNTKGNDNIISNGSGIAVADGQCMLIVEQGRVVEVCAERVHNLGAIGQGIGFERFVIRRLGERVVENLVEAASGKLFAHYVREFVLAVLVAFYHEATL